MENKSSSPIGLKLKLKSLWGKVYTKIKPYLKPTMIVSFGLAWCITNAWGYVLLGLGVWLDIGWAKSVGGGYVALLYMPFFIEKPITFAIAIFIQKLLFKRKEKEKNEKTL